MLDSFAYCRPGSTGLLETTLLGEELSGTARVPVALARIGSASITLENEADGTYVNTRSPGDTPGAKHVIVAAGSPGVVLATSDVKIDATSGALAWRWMAEDTAVANPDTVDVVEYLASIAVNHSDSATPSVFDRWIYATHRLRIPVRPALCVPADVFRQLEWKMSEEKLPLIEFLCEAVTDRFEEEYQRLVRLRSETEVITIDDHTTWSVNLRRFPIVSVQSVKESSTGDFTGVTALSATDLSTPAQGRIGALRHRTRPFTKGDLQVTYTGGIAKSTGAVPPALRNAATRLAAFLAKRAQDIGLTQVTAKDSSVSIFATDMPKDVEHVFDQWRRLL